MRILGIDPGYATVGFGVVDYVNGKFTCVDYGAIQTPAKTPFEDRLEQLFDDMSKLVEYYKPETVAFEELFFNTNTTTAIKVAQGRGVCFWRHGKKGLNVLNIRRCRSSRLSWATDARRRCRSC